MWLKCMFYLNLGVTSFAVDLLLWSQIPPKLLLNSNQPTQIRQLEKVPK